MPALVGPLYIELNKSPRQLLIFPRRRRFARTQPDDCVVHPDRLAGLHRQIAHNPVALVEQAQNRHAIGHRGDPRLLARVSVGRRQPGAIGLLLRLVAAPAPRQKQQCRAGNDEDPHVSPASRADNPR